MYCLNHTETWAIFKLYNPSRIKFSSNLIGFESLSHVTTGCGYPSTGQSNITELFVIIRGFWSIACSICGRVNTITVNGASILKLY